MSESAFPLIPGLTDTASTSEPIYERLVRFLSERPGGGQEKAVEALSALEAAYEAEEDPDVKQRYAAARELIYGRDRGEDAA